MGNMMMENSMMDGPMMMIMMIGMGVFSVLLLMLMVLGILALAKYLRS